MTHRMSARSMMLALAALPLAFAAPAMAQGGNQQPQTQQGRDASRLGRQNQQQQQQQQQQQPQPQARLSREEAAAIRPLQQAVQAQNWEAANAALAAAQAAAQQPVARFEVARLLFQIGAGTQNQQVQQQAVDAMLASGAAPANVVPTLLGARANYAIQANDYAGADQFLTRYLEVDPNNVERLTQAAEVKIHLQRNADALALYQRIIQVQEAGGGQPTEEALRRTAALAADQRQAQLAAQLNDRLLRTYPNARSWQAALIPLRQSAGTDTALALDVRRLMLVAGALPRAGDYLEFASRLDTAGQWGEAKAVLDQGIARSIVSATDSTARQIMTTAEARIREDRPQLATMRSQALAAPTGRQARIAADTHYGYGEFAAAAELYRAALQKGGEDANLLNLRLGASLARAGQRAPAEAAFRAVTGPRQPLANYWLLWLERGTQAAAPASPTQ